MKNKNVNKDINNKPFLILLIAAVFLICGIGGLVLGLRYTIENRRLMLIITILFAAIGVYLFIFGLMRLFTLSAHKKLSDDPNAYQTDATFVSSKFLSYNVNSVGALNVEVPVSANVYKQIVYSYTDEHGNQHTAKSVLSYSLNQVKYLQQKGTFKIKCKGKASVIIEEFPSEEQIFNLLK